jgi:flagellar biosynthesis GTPase FlhF
MKNTLIFLMLAGFIPASFAQSGVDPFCLDDPAVCEQKAAKKAERRDQIRQRCIEDPQWCQEWRTERQRLHAERRALKRQCKANPDQCDELTRQFKEKRAERNEKKREQKKMARDKMKKAREQWCIDNPAVCKQWKAEKRALQEKCRETQDQLLDKYPDIPR